MKKQLFLSCALLLGSALQAHSMKIKKEENYITQNQPLQVQQLIDEQSFFHSQKIEPLFNNALKEVKTSQKNSIYIVFHPNNTSEEKWTKEFVDTLVEDLEKFDINVQGYPYSTSFGKSTDVFINAIGDSFAVFIIGTQGLGKEKSNKLFSLEMQALSIKRQFQSKEDPSTCFPCILGVDKDSLPFSERLYAPHFFLREGYLNSLIFMAKNSGVLTSDGEKILKEFAIGCKDIKVEKISNIKETEEKKRKDDENVRAIIDGILNPKKKTMDVNEFSKGMKEEDNSSKISLDGKYETIYTNIIQKGVFPKGFIGVKFDGENFTRPSPQPQFSRKEKTGKMATYDLVSFNLWSHEFYDVQDKYWDVKYKTIKKPQTFESLIGNFKTLLLPGKEPPLSDTLFIDQGENLQIKMCFGHSEDINDKNYKGKIGDLTLILNFKLIIESNSQNDFFKSLF